MYVWERGGEADGMEGIEVFERVCGSGGRRRRDFLRRYLN